MTKFLTKRNLFFTLNILCMLLCFTIIPFILYQDVITNHDSSYVFQYTYNNNWFSSGRFISRFMASFFYVLIPSTFNIHQNDVSSFIVPAFISFFISIMTIFSLKFYYLFHNRNRFILQNSDFLILYPAIFIITAFIPPINEGMDMFYFSGITETVVFFDDLFNFMFYVIFTYFIVSSFFIKRSKFINVLYFTNAFLLGISYEPLVFTSCLFYILTLVFIGILYKKQIHKNNEKMLKPVILIGIPLLLASFLHLFLSNYSKWKITEYSINIRDQFASIALYYKDFFAGFLKTIVLGNIIPIILILIILLIILILKKDRKDACKLAVLSSSLLITWITYFILLIIPGYCNVYPFDFWYSHPPFRIMFSKTLFCIILLNVGYLISIIKVNGNILKILLVICVYGFLSANFEELNREYSIVRQDIDGMRIKIYISDKMLLTYYALDAIALLPISYYKEYSTYKFIFRPRCYDAEADIRNKMKNIVDKEVDMKKSRLYTNIDENDYLLYIYYTYGIKPEGIIWVDDDIAFSEFEKRGGEFSQQELKELNFTKLLKRKDKKFSLDEINSKIAANPKESYLYAMRAHYYENNENFDEAVNDYTKAIDLDANLYKQYYYLRGEANLRNNNLQAAQKDYISFISSSPYSLEARKRLADLYIEQEKYEKALNIYEEITGIFEFYNENIKKTFYWNIAEIQYRLRRYKDVIETVNKDEKLTPYYANYQARALAKIELNDFEGAYEDINRVFQYNLENESTHKIKQFIELKI